MKYLLSILLCTNFIFAAESQLYRSGGETDDEGSQTQRVEDHGGETPRLPRREESQEEEEDTQVAGDSGGESQNAFEELVPPLVRRNAVRSLTR